MTFIEGLIGIQGLIWINNVGKVKILYKDIKENFKEMFGYLIQEVIFNKAERIFTKLKDCTNVKESLAFISAFHSNFPRT